MLLGFFGIGPLELIILLFLLALLTVGVGGAIAVAVIVSRKSQANPSLTSCPDCQRSVSRIAVTCPGCGRPLSVPPTNH
jgi:hypothetical protein